MIESKVEKGNVEGALRRFKNKFYVLALYKNVEIEVAMKSLVERNTKRIVSPLFISRLREKQNNY